MNISAIYMYILVYVCVYIYRFFLGFQLLVNSARKLFEHVLPIFFAVAYKICKEQSAAYIREESIDMEKNCS